ncbi:hypothetical protein KPL74_00665 [Bacillus sp. NP157]|nr:hypothetical protein KPL74_00665 [Bacillus sp. NP157]
MDDVASFHIVFFWEPNVMPGAFACNLVPSAPSARPRHEVPALLNQEPMHPTDDLAALDVNIAEEEKTMLIAVLQSINGRLDSIDGRLTNIEGRLTNVESRLTCVESRLTNVEGRLTNVEGRLTCVEGTLTRMDARMDRIEDRLDGVDDRLDRIDLRLDRVETRMDCLDVRVEHIERNVGKLQIDVIKLQCDVSRLPSWKVIGAAATGTFVATAAAVDWLSDGGAKTISKWFN